MLWPAIACIAVALIALGATAFQGDDAADAPSGASGSGTGVTPPTGAVGQATQPLITPVVICGVAPKAGGARPVTVYVNEVPELSRVTARVVTSPAGGSSTVAPSTTRPKPSSTSGRATTTSTTTPAGDPLGGSTSLTKNAAGHFWHGIISVAQPDRSFLAIQVDRTGAPSSFSLAPITCS